MQYLLTEEEMEDVRRLRRRVSDLPTVDELKSVCLHVATEMVDPTSRSKATSAKTHPHGCIHVPDRRGPQWNARYCDHCPVRDICPQTKSWSK